MELASLTSKRKLRVYFYWIIISVTTVTLYIKTSVLEQIPLEYFSPKVLSPKDKQQNEIKNSQSYVCKLPKLDPFDKNVMEYTELLQPVKPHNCISRFSRDGGEGVAFVQQKGQNIIKRIRPVDAECCFRPFFRSNKTGEEVKEEEEMDCFLINKNITKIPPEYEFIDVICDDANNATIYRDGFAFVNLKPKVERRVGIINSANKMRSEDNKSGIEKKLSVLILGLDAMSRMNFLRTAPKSNDYLLQNLSAVVMNGYTKVAPNSLPNLIPLLSGLSLPEFKKVCVDPKKAPLEVRLDKCPFIWNRFARSGYRTGYAEDDIKFSTFALEWKYAFEKPPTDYYFRTFAYYMEKYHSDLNLNCYGTRHSFETLLDNMANFATTFKNKLHFHFTWTTKLSHWQLAQFRQGDEPLLEFLKYMKTSGNLNETVLILMGDHGHRMGRIRNTPQGKIEDRMPLFYMVLPPWFSSTYKTAYENLKENSNRLMTVYDIHKTLIDFMDLNRLENVSNAEVKSQDPPSERRSAFSLFDRIPTNRFCTEAGIPLHWCVCQGPTNNGSNKETLKSKKVREAVDYALGSMNYHLREQIKKERCVKLELNEITDAFYIDFGQMKKKDAKEVLRISFTAGPKGSFEATVIRDFKGGLKLSEKVVRTNEYGGKQSNCVDVKFKEYCSCKEKTKKKPKKKIERISKQHFSRLITIYK